MNATCNGTLFTTGSKTYWRCLYDGQLIEVADLQNIFKVCPLCHRRIHTTPVAEHAETKVTVHHEAYVESLGFFVELPDILGGEKT